MTTDTYTYYSSSAGGRVPLPPRAVYEVFEHFGYTWIIHGKPLGKARFSRRKYTVTEASSGRRLRLDVANEQTVADTKARALRYLDAQGVTRTAEVIRSVCRPEGVTQ